jgi:NAD(P)-dependent dehydrogenase (short-subunit alcohol dehydrogenase family)
MNGIGDRRRVLVTGCSSGFGKCITHRFVDAEWEVIGTTRCSEVQGLDESSSSRLQVLSLNIGRSDERADVVRFVQSKWSDGFDCLINNAGYGLAGPLETLTEEQIRDQMEVNFFAPTFLIRELLPLLRMRKGRIINISSVLGFVGMPMQSMYSASKFALEGLTESLYYELAKHDVQVCLVEPGGFRTNFSNNLKFASEERLVDPLYRRHMQGYRNRLKRVMKHPGKNPDKVADVVFQLTQRAIIPLRVRVGNDTRALYYLRKTLPQKIADRLLRGIGNQILETTSDVG